MGALTELSSNVTEFAGDYKIAVVKVDGATGTAGTVTIDEMDTVVAAFTTLAAAPTADAAEVVVTGISGNVITCVEYEDDHTTSCTQNPIDFYLLAVGY
jgi:hypothetical protein